MKSNKIIISFMAGSALLFSTGSFAEHKSPQEEVMPKNYVGVEMQAETNILLRQILAELVKGNAFKELKFSKSYSKDYVSVQESKNVGSAVWYKSKIDGNDKFNRADFSSLKKGVPIVRVNTSTENCQFVIGFYTQNIPENTEYLEVNGRIERGRCDGKEVEKGLALATAQKNKSSGFFEISETVMVIIPTNAFYY